MDIFNKIVFLLRSAKWRVTMYVPFQEEVDHMKPKNVCKFSALSQSHALEIRCFVLETNQEILAQHVQLEWNRAYLFTQGEGTFCVGNSAVNFRPGMLIFGFENEWIRIVPQCYTECMYIDFGGMRGKELMLRFGVGSGNRMFSGMEGVAPLWIESLLRASKLTVDLAAESMLLVSFSRLTRNGPLHGELITHILTKIEERFTETGFTVTALAHDLGYSPKYISSVIKQKTGTGFSEYLQKRRISYAVSLFDHGLDSVKNVAFLSGYADPLYFSTAFKKHMGMSPRDYCAQAVQGDKQQESR